MSVTDLLAVLDECASAVATALRGLDDWTGAGLRPGQYNLDLVADEPAVAVLEAAGLGVLSEESGHQWAERSLTAILDPVDGSTNAANGLPWFATSVCVVDESGPLAALVVNQATGMRFHAARGEGAFWDGRRVSPSSVTEPADALVALSGRPAAHLGWRQYRAWGASALDLCLVAAGALDAFCDCQGNEHGVWDFAAASLVCAEAGAVLVDDLDRELIVLDHTARRTPWAAGTPELLAALRAAHRSAGA